MNERRVLPAGHPLVKQVQRDFRVVEKGAPFMVRLRGEGRYRSAVFPDLAQEPQILLEFIPAALVPRPAALERWWEALRLPYITFSLLPLLLVSAAYYRAQGYLPPLISLLLFLSVALIHVSCNLWGDYEDHLRGVDSPDHDGGSRVIQRLWIPAVHVRNAAALLMILGLATGASLLVLLPLVAVAKPLFVLALAGSLGAASYSGWPFHYKYLGLGEPIIFLLSGPLLTIGASILFYQEQNHLLWASLVSLPLSFLAVLRLHGGNTQRIPFDTMAGVFTAARALGFRWSKRAWAAHFFAPYLITAVLMAAGYAPISAALTLLTLPLALLSISPLRRATGPLDPACHELRERGAQLHLAFGLIYSLSFLFP
ncbi:MAG: prenyltransferase [Proteobacteria bacterium]|nr:MAG: prenyltransferase [Pseudomonadota bacterium]